jgi:hypothetical protein
MLCAICSTVDRLALGIPEGADSAGARDGSLRVCDRCARPVRADFTDLLASKIAQLTRFGLAGRPLLVPRRPSG